jgi:hypothetical protein
MALSGFTSSSPIVVPSATSVPRTASSFQVTPLNRPSFHASNAWPWTSVVKWSTTLIDFSTNGGRRWYDGLQLSARKRLSHGLALNGNYTLSHTDQCGGEDAFGPTVVQDWDNIAASCGTSGLEVRHALVVDYSYELPWGFTLGGITQARSGLPANLVTGRDIRGNGFPSTQRPDLSGGSLYANDQTYLNWYNKAAFANPAAGTFGNIG